MIKHFQIDVGKRFVNFRCRTISLCKAFTVFMYKYDISRYRNAKKNYWYFLCLFVAVERFGNKTF